MAWRAGAGLQIAAALGVYVAASVLLFGFPAVKHPATTYVGKPTADSFLFLWSLGWWPHALAHGLNPFLAKVVWAPTGYNLTWATSIPGPSVVLWPVTKLFGPAASYNVMTLLAPALSAWTAFILCRRITQRFWPSLVGGYVFGFSTYELGHLRGHPNLSLVFLLPVCAYLVLRRYDGSLSTRAFVPLMTVVLVGEFSISIEVFATTTVFGVLTLAASLLVLTQNGRRRLLRTSAWVAAAYGIAVVAIGPYLYAMAAYPKPFRVVPVHLVRASTDLANLVVPNETIGPGHGLFPDVSVNFARPLPVGGSYVGIVLLAVMVAFAWSARKTALGRLLPALFFVFVVASLGPVLKVSGPTGVPMPWRLALGLPLIHRALPGRFVVYAFLVLAIAVAVWASLGGRFWWGRWLTVAAGALLLFPNLALSSAAKTAAPPFIEEGLYQRVLTPGELVVSAGIPIGRSMLFQAEADMYFRLPAGYFGSSPPGVPQRQIARAVSSGRPPVFETEEVRTFLRSSHIRAIVVIALRPHRRAQWRHFLRFLHVRPIRLGGADVYRLSAG
jgi:hypothetical protein